MYTYKMIFLCVFVHLNVYVLQFVYWNVCMLQFLYGLLNMYFLCGS